MTAVAFPPVRTAPIAVQWSPDGEGVRIIDQRLLPGEYLERDLRTVGDVCDAIATLAVRGAPAIGVAGAMGLAVAMGALASLPRDRFPRAFANTRTASARLARRQ